MKQKYNYFLEVKNIIKNEDEKISSEVLSKRNFNHVTSNNILELDLIFYTLNYGPFSRRYDWIDSKNDVNEEIKDTPYEHAGKIVFDLDSYDDLSKDDLKIMTTKFCQALNREILFYTTNKDLNKDEWKAFAEKQILRIAQRIFEFKTIKYNFNLINLCNRYIFNDFPVNLKDFAYIPNTPTRWKPYDNVKLNEVSIETSSDNGIFYAIAKCNDFKIKTPITESEYKVLRDEIPSYKNPTHEWCQLYGSSTTFTKDKIRSVLRDRFKRYYFSNVKNRFNFNNDNIIRFDFYLKSSDLELKSESLEFLGYVELDQDQIENKLIDFVIRSIKELIVEPLYQTIKNGKKFNKYEVADFISKKMDKVYALYENKL